MVRKKNKERKDTSFRLNLCHRPRGVSPNSEKLPPKTMLEKNMAFFFTFFMIFVKTQSWISTNVMFKKSDVLESEVQSVSLSRILLPLRALSLIHVPPAGQSWDSSGVGVGPWFNHGLYSGNNFQIRKKRVAEVPGRYHSVRLRVWPCAFLCPWNPREKPQNKNHKKQTAVFFPIRDMMASKWSMHTKFLRSVHVVPV